MYSNFGIDHDQFTMLSNGWTLPIHNARALSMCGNCNHPTAVHPVIEGDFTICDNDFATMELREGFDYLLHSASGNITLIRNDAGEPANILLLTEGVEVDNQDGTTTTYRIEDDPNEYVNLEALEYEALSRWTDRNPEVTTHALDYWYVTPERIVSGTYDTTHKNAVPRDYSFTPATSNAFMEGMSGFFTEQGYDPEVTGRYHERLLNSFIHKKSGKFHVGSIEFSVSGSIVSAACINRECYVKTASGNYERSTISIDRSVATRDAMEDFIFQVIRHGNNHGPDWLTSRPDFYKIHFHDCDLNCGNGITCNHNHTKVDVDLTDVEFVMEHQNYCKDSNCKCAEWLANEVPALAS